MHKRVAHGRICKNSELSLVVDLGSQALIGVFPESFDEHAPHGPLVFVTCTEKSGDYELVRFDCVSANARSLSIGGLTFSPFIDSAGMLGFCL
ncbi:MAG: hypothetical protein WCQ91_06520 [Planctomycetota bacterium]